MNVKEAAAGRSDDERITFQMGGVMLKPGEKAKDAGSVPVSMTVANARMLGWLK